ncbi:hypothetical protein BDR04DRAFT_1118340 [Suillus decipiens]|nr:hypothetical protein BDR04DRAFT_1118340 [Suillus decipiens]
MALNRELLAVLLLFLMNEEEHKLGEMTISTPKLASEYASGLCSLTNVLQIIVDAATPPAATTYDLCWDEEPQPTMTNIGHTSTPSAAEYQAANNPESSGSQNTWPFAAPTKALVRARVEAGEVSASNDIAEIQNMLQIWRQINDPLTVLEQDMKKGGD